MKIHIEPLSDGCKIVGNEIHTTHNLPLPLSADQLLEMIEATASTINDGNVVRSEMRGVSVDKTSTGVRIAHNQAWFDVHWTNILAGIKVAA